MDWSEAADETVQTALVEALEGRVAAVRQVGGWFVFDHLKGNARMTSRSVCETAVNMLLSIPDSPELTVGLRKLLEAKDCFVRASIAGRCLMARRLGIDEKAVAYAVLEDLLGEDEIAICWDNQDVNGVAHHVLEAADIEFQPRARKLILTFDLSDPGPELMQSQGDLRDIAVAAPGSTLADVADPV